jgi:hypothetical protein
MKFPTGLSNGTFMHPFSNPTSFSRIALQFPFCSLAVIANSFNQGAIGRSLLQRYRASGFAIGKKGSVEAVVAWQHPPPWPVAIPTPTGETGIAFPFVDVVACAREGALAPLIQKRTKDAVMQGKQGIS